MLRILAVAIIALFPLIAQAEEQAKKEEEVVVIVSVDKQTGEVKISISKESKNEKVIVPEKKHSRRRGK
jgi:hypothetical protein